MSLRSNFQGREYSLLDYKSLKGYPSQTKISEGLTKDEMWISKEALFKGVSTRFGLLTIQKCFENLHFIFCQTFQNLRLGSIKVLLVISTE